MVIAVTAHTQAVYEMMRKTDVLVKDWAKRKSINVFDLKDDRSDKKCICSTCCADGKQLVSCHYFLSSVKPIFLSALNFKAMLRIQYCL